ncbi:ankyrin domain protein [Moritella sp. JT01]|nr:ankyrin domain protein [Moritella sp. JT01]
MNIEHLISYSDNNGNGSTDANLFNDASKFYLEHFRTTENDIQQLQQNSGIEFILNGSNDYKYQTAEIFLENGLDINGVNHFSNRNINALHSAVLLKNKDNVLFLLKHGIDINAKTKNGFTALDWARKIYDKTPTKELNAIIQILEIESNT